MLQRPGCLAPISLVFVAGFLLVVAGLMADSPRQVRAGAACLAAAMVLLLVGWWMRRKGWWD
jgi:hypothetical protein